MPLLFSFKKKDRLLKRSEFLQIGNKGKKIRTRHFLILFSSNNLGIKRLGTTASKKIGNAVKRNRVKRVLREFFRLNREKLCSFEDIVIIAGKGSFLLAYEDVQRELLEAFNVNMKDFEGLNLMGSK